MKILGLFTGARREIQRQLDEVNQERARAVARLEAAVRNHTATTLVCSDRGCTIRKFGAKR